MTKKHIKKLAQLSFTRNNLDGKKVGSIARLLKRSELKEYLRTLKSIESQRKVHIVIPDLSVLKKIDKEKFIKLFPNKKVLFEEDPRLLVGVKVINNDQVFEFSLKNTLDNLDTYIENQYD